MISNKVWNVSSALTFSFAAMIGGVLVYAFYKGSIDVRSCIEGLAGLYLATLQMLKSVIEKETQ